MEDLALVDCGLTKRGDAYEYPRSVITRERGCAANYLDRFPSERNLASGPFPPFCEFLSLSLVAFQRQLARERERRYRICVLFQTVFRERFGRGKMADIFQQKYRIARRKFISSFPRYFNPHGRFPLSPFTDPVSRFGRRNKYLILHRRSAFENNIDCRKRRANIRPFRSIVNCFDVILAYGETK